MSTRIVSWNVKEFGKQRETNTQAKMRARVRKIAQLVREQAPSIFGILEVESIDILSFMQDEFPNYDFGVTDGLESLTASGTQVTDLSPLAALITLQFLLIAGTPVTELAPLSGLKILQSLDISGTQVDDLTPLKPLSALQYLDASDTPVADLASLSCLNALKHLYILNTQVEDFTPLNSLPELQYVDVMDSQVMNRNPVANN